MTLKSYQKRFIAIKKASLFVSIGDDVHFTITMFVQQKNMFFKSAMRN